MEVGAPGRGPRRARLLRPRRDRAALGERLRRGPVRPEAEVGLDRPRAPAGGRRARRPRGSARPPRSRRAARAAPPRLSPSFTAAASSRRARALRQQLLPRRLGGEGAVRRHGDEVALVEQRAREAAQRRALAPAVALERDAAVEGVERARRPRPPAARPATPPTPRRRARPPAPRRPCGSRGGPRTRAAAPGGPGRTARGWSRRSPARSPRGRRATRARSAPGVRASARARSSRSRRRSFMVVAAFSVKVTAAISSRRAAPVRTIASMRSTRSVVFPVPAPASSTRLVAWSRRARSRASSSTGRKPLTRRPSAAGTPAAPGRGP